MKYFEKFAEFVMSLKKDKWLHLIGGLLIFALGLWKLPIGNENILFLVACGITAFVGASKEIILDKWMGKGTPEWNDFWATIMIPGAITVLQLLITLI